jgi:hypothetical protein
MPLQPPKELCKANISSLQRLFSQADNLIKWRDATTDHIKLSGFPGHIPANAKLVL